MNPWAVLAIALATLVVLLWAIAAVDQQVRRRRRDRELWRRYRDQHTPAGDGAERLRDRRPW